ncbi:sulfur carrier protein ThiS [Methylocapsa aurea]|uniref:sulfur carrier protein ThiS n=1 Tax=Methylocapsa aurea TaxID=663610 RepID=UPI000565FF90|nr:sulfur carrier protein ThiS [Methylocapsa aurea]
MRIQVNGKALDVSATTLAALLSELGVDEAIVATALNQNFIRKTERQRTQVKEGDAVEILTPRQGG